MDKIFLLNNELPISASQQMTILSEFDYASIDQLYRDISELDYADIGITSNGVDDTEHQIELEQLWSSLQ